MARALRSGSRLDTGLLAACVLLALLATVLPMPIRDAIASSLRSTVVSPLLGLQMRAERARNSFVEREHVAAHIDSLARRVDDLTELEAENVRLRKLIALGRQLRWGFVPAEALHGQGLGEKHSLVLTVGSAAGVKTRSAVVAPEGLVGQITTVDPTSSLAIMWTHPDFRASAMAADGSAFGIVTPHLGTEADDPNRADQPDRFLLEMRGVAFRDALKPGTLINTSGLGGVFPRGIPIGVVIGEIRTSEQWSRTYLVRSAVHPADVTNVMVLSPQRVTDSLSAVWSSPAKADSGARRIAAVGDSMALDSAAQAAARRRVLDSTASALAAPPVPPPTRADTTPPRTAAAPARADSVRRAATRPPARRDTARARKPPRTASPGRRP